MTQPNLEQMIEFCDCMLTGKKPSWFVECNALDTENSAQNDRRFRQYLISIRAALTEKVLPEEGNRLPLEEIPEGWRFQKLLFNDMSGYECWLINSGVWRDFSSSGKQSNFCIGRGLTPAEALRAAIAAAKDGAG